MSHNNEHNHGSCGCCCGGCCHNQEIALTVSEKAFLEKLAQIPFLEVVNFMMKSSKSTHLESIALADVHISDKGDSMEKIKETAAVLDSLYDYGIIDINYNLPIEGSDYSMYRGSDVYLLLEKTILDGRKNENFLFDTADLECGSVALTAFGQEFI